MTTYSLTSDDVRVLAFVRGWSPDQEGQTQLELLRLRVMEVGVELIVLGERGVWVFGVDGRIAIVDRVAGGVPLSATMYAARRGDAAYLIDDGDAARIAYNGTLFDALTGAGEMLAMRGSDDAPADSTMPNGRFAQVFESASSSESTAWEYAS